MTSLVPVEVPEARVDYLVKEVGGFDPQVRARIRHTLRTAMSESLTRGMARAARYHKAWLQLRFGTTASDHFPAWERDHLITFITDHAYAPPANIDELLCRPLPANQRSLKKRPGGWKFATIEHHLSMLTTVCRLRGMPAPNDDATIRYFLQSTRKAMAKDPGRRERLSQSTPAITRDTLFELVTLLEAESHASHLTLSLSAKRDLALLLLGFGAGGRRRSEISAIRCVDLEAADYDDESTLALTIPLSKTDQKGEGKRYLLPPVAASAVRDWLSTADVDAGPVFRRISKSGRVLPYGLTPDGVYYVLKARFKSVGKDLSPHSLRAGYVTEAGRQGRDQGQTMRMTGHRSVSAFMGYFDAGALQKNASVEVLGEALSSAKKKSGQ
ncbi:hypothetical protein RM531_08900 [Salinisphaera sp. P385]|uniref:Tyr recombinase domain-containing protein n=1 Tax=Spectribacter acetivorans TaxID=3075603 RepID=A0ABU3B809_9GAMM|nr:hypothetical protein [Salinisphaera sp. P385]MDT0618596.1 hypothetical protein [Salinisphaera sp. P385]